MTDVDDSPLDAKMAAPERDIRLPSLAALQAFEATARLGSFEKAGERLCVSASAVGKRVAGLEDLIGRPLFTRTAHGLVLNLDGTEYLEQIRRVLAMLGEVSLHKSAVRRAERLRLATPPTFARQILVPHLDEFTSRYPEIEVEVVLSIPYLDLSPPSTDLEIRFGRGEYPGWLSRRLIEENVFPVCAPSCHERANGLRRHLDLAECTLLRSPLEPWKPWFRAVGLDWKEPTAGPQLVDLGMLLEAAVNGHGVALARATLAKPWLDAGTLVRPFAESARPNFFYYVCYEALRPLEGARAAFVDWLVRVCSGLVREDAA